jgi:transposase
MRHLIGTPRNQTQLLPPSIEDYLPSTHPVRVIDAFVDSLDCSLLGFQKAEAATTGRRPYHPGDLLKLYLYGYLNQTSSTRRLEKECHRNLEVMWLLKALKPDFKTIADFRKDNGAAIKGVCRQFIVFCRQAGLVSGQLVAIDGSKFKAAASKDQAISRKQLQKQLGKLDQKIERYLSALDQSEDERDSDLNDDRVAEALAYLQAHKASVQQELESLIAQGVNQHCRTEADAKLMKSGRSGMVVGYNAQQAVDSQHQLIVAHELTQSASDNQQLAPMVKAVGEILDKLPTEVLADAGYSNGEQIGEVQSLDVEVAVPSNRAINNQGNGSFFQKKDFTYLPEENAYRCPSGELLHYKTLSNKDRLYLYSRTGCSQCSLMGRCTKADQRWVTRHFDEEALQKADQAASARKMRKRMAIVEPPFGTLKRLMNQGRFTCWGLQAASSEYSLGVLSYNLMRAINVLGVEKMMTRLA